MTHAWARTLAAVLALVAGTARADGFQASHHRHDALLSVTWDVAVPVARLREFVSDPGYGGIQIEVRRGIARSLSLGVAASWAWLAQSDRSASLQLGDATFTGPIYQRVRMATFRGTAHWYLTRGSVQPYVGVGAGGVSYETYRMVAGSVLQRADWSLTADPQLGLLWAVAPGAALHFQLRYQYTTARFLPVREASWIGLDVGFAAY